MEEEASVSVDSVGNAVKEKKQICPREALRKGLLPRPAGAWRRDDAWRTMSALADKQAVDLLLCVCLLLQDLIQSCLRGGARSVLSTMCC